MRRGSTSRRPARPHDDDWQRLHPLSPLLRGGFVLLVVAGILFASLRDRLIDLFVADELTSYLGPSESDLIDYLVERRLIVVALAILLGAVLLIVLLGWLSWRFNTYRITSEAVEERSGVLFRQHRRAPLDRVQSVNLQRPLLARAVGLTQVNVQTAGQGGRVALRYLGHRTAKEVRERILRDAEAAREQPGAPTAAPALAAGLTPGIEQRARDFLDADIATEALEADTLVAVPIRRLIGSILLGWDLLVPAVILVGAIVVGSVWSPFALLLIIPVGLALIGIAYGQFNRGFRFVLSRGPDGVRVGAGLTATVTETIPFGRIHALEARQPLGWRPFGWWKMRITTAGHAVSQGGQNRLQNTVLPVGRLGDGLRVFAAVLPGLCTRTLRAGGRAARGARRPGRGLPRRGSGCGLGAVVRAPARGHPRDRRGGSRRGLSTALQVRGGPDPIARGHADGSRAIGAAAPSAPASYARSGLGAGPHGTGPGPHGDAGDRIGAREGDLRPARGHGGAGAGRGVLGPLGARERGC
ncbi:MAG: hypothetical protein D3X82_12900 [Candidatus Leucobacter sulfamidivorax]|nr:hypothetical protein [Candidatus Leucobacter sulfamidivorax]